jgi:ferredoxin-NADP reductase
VTVADRRALTPDVVELTLTAERTEPFPDWEPGAHIDLELPDGALRQYSLCGRPGAAELRIAVLREDGGRGGSVAVHDRLRVGDRLRVRGPRNHFRLRPAGTLLFVAGGIGITPLLPMIEEAAHRGSDWRLLYLGRSADRMAYLDELTARHGARVEAWPSRDRGRLDLDRAWDRLPDRDGYVYACGPEVLLTGLEDSARRAGREDHLVVERFAARPAVHGPNHAFEVVLARSGAVVAVAEDDTVLDAVNRAGAGVLSTCREGTCGTCEVRVLDGVPEHRDSVLSLEERLAEETMMTCVSRCRGRRLVLDL